ncbi:MAG: 30S ribosomal protein S14 [Chloroflexi bacterium]|nr:30S ribosomal protein S14 [Chloroflexota bacterium]
MAKKSQLARDQKRRAMHDHYKDQRAALKAKLRESVDDPQARWDAQVALQKLPRNSSPTRLKSRCEVTGRSRGYMRKFGLSRITFREMASQGLLPGIRKSSW